MINRHRRGSQFIGRLTFILPLVAVLATVALAQGASEVRAYFTEPAISPDRSEIAFVSGGDIWTVAAAGGEARLLVSHPANESRPVYSPHGRRLAFVSARTCNGHLCILTLETGDLRRLTFSHSPDQLE